MVTEIAKELPHGEKKQGIILHSFSLYESLHASKKKKAKKYIKKNQRIFSL